MTTKHSIAYETGFRKTAEAFGIDPAELVKSAQALRTLVRPFTRYWELLAGTGKATRGYRALCGRLDSALNAAVGRQDAAAIRKLRGLKSRLDTAAHNYNRVLKKPFWDELAEFGIAPEGSMFSNGLMRAGNGGYRFGKKVTGELDKVLATRLGTGGAALGAGYLAFGPGGYEED